MFTIYTKDYCPYCTMAKQLLSGLKIPYKEIDISRDPKAFEELKARSRMLTVPQIFAGDICLGGYTQLAELHKNGKLLNLHKNHER